MPYENTHLIKEDVLFRGGESKASSDYASQVVDYINRVYRTLCTGASEFLPEYVEDWWWMRSRGTLTLLPAQTGNAAVTQDSTAITFAVAPAQSVAGYKFKVDDHPEVFEISSHTAAATAATLDSPYTGPTNSGASYRLMKLKYTLDSSVAAILGPMIGYRNNPRIYGIEPERMDELYPTALLTPGVPRAFALDDLQIVRFSHGGLTNGQSMRVEYRFRSVVTTLTDDTSSIPLVPLEWRHLLADMALTYLLLDKNDDRSNAVALSARTGLAAMLKENRRKLAKMGGESLGRIYPRQAQLDVPGNPDLLRTESGLIIG